MLKLRFGILVLLWARLALASSHEDAFSFQYDGQPAPAVLRSWKRTELRKTLPDGRKVITTAWTDPHSGLCVTEEWTQFPKYDSADWVLRFENRGEQDSGLIENVQALDLRLSDSGPFRLHRSLGASATPADFEPSVVELGTNAIEHLAAGGGRSSNRDFPFFKIECADRSYIFAIGWSGQWQATVERTNGAGVHITAGLEKTHFRLHPGESVRSPRILVYRRDGDTLECNAQFRQLIFRYYAAKKNGAPAMPTLFCNTAFTRGGMWLNECNASNQISLINAYAPLGLEALITDAGWFEGGWPNGAGNWTPRHDAYPDGMRPVAAAARAHGMMYGLWFEPERAIAGTDITKKYPEAMLHSGAPNDPTLLANFGEPEIRDYFFNIVRGFMELPGFRFYRQDFNMDPLVYWLHGDAPDRQGITEMKYIEGLYAYWDRLATNWPDGLREECASGGRRFDLETISRMQLHQKSDYWFDNDVDQASLWTLNQYVPNSIPTLPINRMDDYTFRSILPSSIIVGWIADAPDFDTHRAKQLLQRYLEIRHLLVGAWYPLLPYSRKATDWMASQYHRPDLGEGMVLAFRHDQSPVDDVELKLHGLEPKAIYLVTSDRSGSSEKIQGSDLMKHFILTLPEKHSSDLVYYRKVK